MNFLKNLKLSEYLLIGICIALLISNFICKGKNGDVVTVETVCDTIRIKAAPDSLAMIPAVIPVPDTVFETVLVPVSTIDTVTKIIHVTKSDTIYQTEFIPKLVFKEQDNMTFIYDSTIHTKNYNLRYYIKTDKFGLQAFHHSLSFTYEMRQTNNYMIEKENRDWLLLGDFYAFSPLDRLDIQYMVGGSVYRTWKRFAVGGGYASGIRENRTHLVKGSIGLRF